MEKPGGTIPLLHMWWQDGCRNRFPLKFPCLCHRETLGAVSFEIYTSFVVDLDNNWSMSVICKGLLLIFISKSPNPCVTTVARILCGSAVRRCSFYSPILWWSHQPNHQFNLLIFAVACHQNVLYNSDAINIQICNHNWIIQHILVTWNWKISDLKLKLVI